MPVSVGSGWGSASLVAVPARALYSSAILVSVPQAAISFTDAEHAERRSSSKHGESNFPRKIPTSSCAVNAPDGNVIPSPWHAYINSFQVSCLSGDEGLHSNRSTDVQAYKQYTTKCIKTPSDPSNNTGLIPLIPKGVIHSRRCGKSKSPPRFLFIPINTLDAQWHLGRRGFCYRLLDCTAVVRIAPDY